MSSSLASQSLATRASQFYQLTKPRVVSLIVFTAVIGMFLATPGMVPLQALVAGTLGIALTRARRRRSTVWSSRVSTRS